MASYRSAQSLKYGWVLTYWMRRWVSSLRVAGGEHRLGLRNTTQVRRSPPGPQIPPGETRKTLPVPCDVRQGCVLKPTEQQGSPEAQWTRQCCSPRDILVDASRQAQNLVRTDAQPLGPDNEQTTRVCMPACSPRPHKGGPLYSPLGRPLRQPPFRVKSDLTQKPM